MRLAATYCFLAVLGFGCGVANAKDYCLPQPKAETEGEGAIWHIPESAFTKETANKALQELSAQVNKGVKGRDFLVENNLRMIKGYLYRAYLAEHKKEFGTEDVFLRTEFCEFLRSDAFVSH